MIIPRFCRFFCLFLLLASCAQAEAPLAMPKEFLGYWHPYSRGTAKVGLEIFPDGRMEGRADDKTRKLIESYEYKIITIENGKVVMAVKSVYAPDFVKENGEKGAWMAIPRYWYYSMSIKRDSDSTIVLLHIEDHVFNKPKKEDWVKPASWHREWITQHPLTGLSGETYAR